MKRIITGAVLALLILIIVAPPVSAQGIFSMRRVASQVLNEGILLPEPHEAMVFFDDFLNYDAGGATDMGWITTAVGTSPVDLWDEEFGVLRIITGATENNGDQLQWNAECFKLDDEEVTFETRIRSVEDVEIDIAVGLIITDTTVIDATEPSDGIYFQKLDGDSLIVGVIRKNTSAVNLDTLGVIVDNTWVGLKFTVGNRIVRYYVDGKLQATTTMADTLSLPEDEVLTPTIACETGAAAAESLYVDYLWARQKR